MKNLWKLAHANSIGEVVLSNGKITVLVPIKEVAKKDNHSVIKDLMGKEYDISNTDAIIYLKANGATDKKIKGWYND